MEMILQKELLPLTGYVHGGCSPVGMKITCETELTKVDGRALTFSVKAFDEAGLIGEGEHERFIVYNEKFQAKADAKLAK